MSIPQEAVSMWPGRLPEMLKAVSSKAFSEAVLAFKAENQGVTPCPVAVLQQVHPFNIGARKLSAGRKQSVTAQKSIKKPRLSPGQS
jgi:hypothetical protein